MVTVEAEASTLTVAVTATGAVQARGEQSHTSGLIVTAMVYTEPALPLQLANLVVTLSVIVTASKM